MRKNTIKSTIKGLDIKQNSIEIETTELVTNQFWKIKYNRREPTTTTELQVPD